MSARDCKQRFLHLLSLWCNLYSWHLGLLMNWSHFRRSQSQMLHIAKVQKNSSCHNWEEQPHHCTEHPMSDKGRGPLTYFSWFCRMLIFTGKKISSQVLCSGVVCVGLWVTEPVSSPPLNVLDDLTPEGWCLHNSVQGLKEPGALTRKTRLPEVWLT